MCCSWTSEGLILSSLLGWTCSFLQATIGYVATPVQFLCRLHEEGKGIFYLLHTGRLCVATLEAPPSKVKGGRPYVHQSNHIVNHSK